MNSTTEIYTRNISFPSNRALALQWNRVNVDEYMDSVTSFSHTHPYYEMYVYVSGAISFSVNDRVFPLECGDIVVTRPGMLHHAIVDGVCRHNHYCINFFTFDPSLEVLFDGLSERVHIRMRQERKDRFLSLMESLSDMFSTAQIDPFSKLSSVYALFSMLLPETGAATDLTYPENLRQILFYIRENYATIRTVRQLCEMFFISQSSLERIFRQHLHITPYKYLFSMKMNGACRMLNEGKSVMDAAMLNGFSDCSLFIADFRKQFGLTPNQYKKQLDEVECIQ